MPVVTAIIILLTAGPVAAQSPAQSPDVPGTSRPVSAGLLGGVSAGSGDAGASAGAVLTFDATDRIAVEARSVFLQRGSGAHGLELTGTALMSIAASKRAAPYIAVGGGLYRASFALGDDRLFGQMGSQFASGTQFVPARGMGFGMMTGGMTFNGNIWTDTWTGPAFTASQMPMIYANRLGQMKIPSGGRWMMRSYTDPALTVGGGIRFDVTNRVYVKPDVRALVVFGGGDRQVLTTMVVGLGYRF
ncbi:MAG: hypothetical protein K2Y23_03885 [Cyanobacteria bacterium]|nr:hypothetical protein [Cyanobacteriota bacterium]